MRQIQAKMGGETCAADTFIDMMIITLHARV
jgi:hypothetical protein